MVLPRKSRWRAEERRTEDADGNPGHEMVITVSFAAIGSQTRLTLHQAVFETVAARDDHRRGWSSTMEHDGLFP